MELTASASSGVFGLAKMPMPIRSLMIWKGLAFSMPASSETETGGLRLMILSSAEGSSWGAGAAGSAAAGAAAGAGAASAARDAFFLLPESKSRASFLTGAGREGAGAGAGWGARFFLEDPPIRSNTSFLGSFSSCLLGILI